MANVELKQPIVEEISKMIDGACGVVLAEYSGITVEQDTELRRKFREEGVTYKIFKNTLVKRAIDGTDYEALKDDLKGPTAIAVSKEDPTAPARILADFSKEVEAIVLKSGIIDGTYYGNDKIGEIANIPSREVLLARLFGSWKSPVTNFARVIAQIAEKAEEGTPAPEQPAAEEAVAEEAAAPEAEAEVAETTPEA